MVNRRRSAFFLGEEKEPRPPTEFYMRKKIIIKYHALLKKYAGKLRIYENIFEAMAVAREDKEYLSRGELVAVLRRPLSMDDPNRAELNHLNYEVKQFRKWLGTLAGLLIYVRVEKITDSKEDFEGKEWIYRSLKSKEYIPIHKHLNKVRTAIVERMTDNDELVAMTEKEILKRINEIKDQLELKAKGYDIHVGRKKKTRKK